jgi:membrane protease YdiL (CAAX protease family)
VRPSVFRLLLSLPLFVVTVFVGGGAFAFLALTIGRLVGRPISLDELSDVSLAPGLLYSWTLLAGTALAAAVVTGYWLGFHRRALGFPWRPAAAVEVAVGLGLGAGSALLLGIAYLATGAEVRTAASGVGGLAAVAVAILSILPAAVAEEWMFREYLIRALNARGGRTLGVVVASAVFVVAHFPNAGGTAPLAMVDVFVAGVALGIAYRTTGALWLPAAWHFAWNATLGGLLGLPVSGIEFASLVRVVPAGPGWWTGGRFGAEASVVAVTADLAALVVFVAISRRVARASWSGRTGRVDTFDGRF